MLRSIVSDERGQEGDDQSQLLQPYQVCLTLQEGISIREKEKGMGGKEVSGLIWGYTPYTTRYISAIK